MRPHATRLLLATAVLVSFLGPLQADLAQAQPPVLLGSWPTVGIPLGLDVNNLGEVCMADEGGVTLTIYSQNGAKLASIYTGIGFEQYGVKVLADQTIVVADYYLTQILRLDRNGNLRDAWPSGGLRALYLALDESENIFVTDDEGDRVRKFTKAGQPLDEWATPHPAGITYLDGRVFVAGMFDGLMKVYTPAGTLLSTFPTGCSWAEQLEHDAYGRLYLTDHGGHRLRCFQSDGTPLWTLGPAMAGYPHPFVGFFSVVPLPNGSLLAGDYEHRRVLVLGDGATAVANPSWGTIKARYR